MEALMETRLPNLMYRGKVRDTYSLDDKRLLMVASDRISAFDVVLPTGIPLKGLVLSRISSFWFDKTAHLIPNHLIAMGDTPGAIPADSPVGEVPAGIARQAMVVKKAERVDVECIVRGYLAGSAWAEYQKQGTVFGKSMPAGLQEGEIFPEPIFTPTTKAEEGTTRISAWRKCGTWWGRTWLLNWQRRASPSTSSPGTTPRGKGLSLPTLSWNLGSWMVS